MKSFKLFWVCVWCLLVTCGAAYAQDGNFAKGCVYVPGVCEVYSSSQDWRSQHIIVFNITNSDVTMKIQLFDKNGNDITNHGSVYTMGNATSAFLVSENSGTANIPPHGTRLYIIQKGITISSVGYAVIGWTSDDHSVRHALVAGLRAYGKLGGQYVSHAVTINGGNPF